MQPSPTEPTAPLDIDLYCMRCGYNLRGLAGDPIRCPECAQQNAIETVTETAALVGRHIARVESAMLSMVLAMLMMVPFALLAVQTGRGGRGPRWMLVGVLLAPVFWYRSMRQYASLTSGISSAVSAAVAYQAGAILWCLFVGFGLLWPLFVYENHYRTATAARTAKFCSAAFVGVAVLVAVPRYSRWIRTRLHPLKREVAVKVVETFLRSRDRHAYMKQTAKFESAVDNDFDRK